VAATSAIIPPVRTSASSSQVVFVYSDVIVGVWVGDKETGLLSLVEMNETTTKYATSVQEPNHPMYHP